MNQSIEPTIGPFPTPTSVNSHARSLPNMATSSPNLSTMSASASSGGIGGNAPNTENRVHTWGPMVPAEPGALRPVVIDGSNVAMQLGKKIFATRGILICARYFISKGHQVITFVPQYRRTQREDNFKRPLKDQYLLDWMHEREMLIYTPSRIIQHEDSRRRVICYDDFNIVQYAHETGGVIVSKDLYRDVMLAHPEWTSTARDRLVMFSWVGEMFMPAEDPFGRHGPRLDAMLRFGPNDRIAPFKIQWTHEQREKLLKEIDEVLAAPPPPPRPPHGADSEANGSEAKKSSSMVDLATLSSAAVPRYGFTRRDSGGGFGGFNHRSRRWMQSGNGMKMHTSASVTGFSPINTNGWFESERLTEDRQSTVPSFDSGPVADSVASQRPPTTSSGFAEWFSGRDFEETSDWPEFEHDLIALDLEAISLGQEMANQDESDSDRDANSPDQPASSHEPEINVADQQTDNADQGSSVSNQHVINSDQEVVNTQHEVISGDPDATIRNQNTISPDQDLFKVFADVFPSNIVRRVLTDYSKIQNLELLSNLMADALYCQSEEP